MKTHKTNRKGLGIAPRLDPRNICSKCNAQLTGQYPGAFEPVVCYSCRQKALEPAPQPGASGAHSLETLVK